MQQQVKHGTNNGWLQGCRRRCCTLARDRWNYKMGVLGRNTGRTRPVTAAVRHIEFLMNSYNVSVESIARTVNAPPTTLRKWISDDTASTRTPELVDRVLGLTLKDLDLMKHPVKPSQRRLQALAYRGFSGYYIGQRYGIHSTHLDYIREGTWSTVNRDLAERIRKLCQELMIEPEPQGLNADRVRKNAKEKGYLPFGVWEDIDDPDCVPEMDDPEYADPVLQDGVERCRSLTARGFTLGEIADVCGIPRPNLHKIVHGKKKGVFPETTKKIHAGCDQLDILPDSTGPFADRARRIAKRNGWR